MPEKHHLYTALQAKPSPGIQTYRDALFPARQTPREAPGSSVSQSRSWSCDKQTLRIPETPCIEQGVVLSCRFAEWKVRRAPRVLRMAVVSQSSVKFGKKRVFLVGTNNFMTITAEVATSKFVLLSLTRTCD